MSSTTTDLQLPEGAWRTDPMPAEGEFFVEDQYGDLIKVRKWYHPEDGWTCVQPRTGRLFSTRIWAPPSAFNDTRADTGRLSELEAEVARLRSALQFYANEANWIDTPSWDGDPECITPKAIPVNRSDDGGSPCDCGDRARAALEAKS